MEATWQGHVIAESDQTIELSYEAPRPSYAHVTHWIGFWNNVELQR